MLFRKLTGFNAKPHTLRLYMPLTDANLCTSKFFIRLSFR